MAKLPEHPLSLPAPSKPQAPSPKKEKPEVVFDPESLPPPYDHMIALHKQGGLGLLNPCGETTYGPGFISPLAVGTTLPETASGASMSASDASYYSKTKNYHSQMMTLDIETSTKWNQAWGRSLRRSDHPEAQRFLFEWQQEERNRGGIPGGLETPISQVMSDYAQRRVRKVEGHLRQQMAGTIYRMERDWQAEHRDLRERINELQSQVNASTTVTTSITVQTTVSGRVFRD